MKEVNRYKLQAPTGQLGSLEDVSGVKRLDTTTIRRMRLQTHEQTKIGNSTVRSIQTFWRNLNASLSLLFTPKPKDYCLKNGHKPYAAYGGVAKCKECGVEVKSIEEFFGYNRD